MHEYEAIKRGRAMLQANQAGAPSDRTVAGYRAKTKRLVRLARARGGVEIDGLIACAKQTRSASTWFSRRAALMYSFRLGAEKLLAEQDKEQRALKAAQVPIDSGQWDAWKNMAAKIGQLVAWHERLQSESGPPIEERKRRHSKRKDMRGLPDDWRERLIGRLPKYRHAVLAAAVTGCRPDELTRGVRLSIIGGNLVAEIEGAKVTAKSGQPWRRLSWPVDSDSPLVVMLAEEVRDGLQIAKIEDAKAYSGAVRAAGEREWPRRKSKLSAYCFRHAAASDMKAGGLDDALISQALGHCADVARSYYGQWQMGTRGGGVAPQMVAAAREVMAKRVPLPCYATSSRRSADSTKNMPLA